MRPIIPMKKRQAPLARRDEQRDPFALLQSEMNRLFSEFNRGFGLAPFAEETGTWAPLVNVTENEKQVCVTAELPGLDENNIELSLSKDALTIRGEKSGEEEEKGQNFYRMERRYGSFIREVSLPCDVEAEKVEATMKKGILTVTLPKSRKAEAQSRRIKVNKA